MDRRGSGKHLLAMDAGNRASPCARCGAAAAKHASFCSQCGARLVTGDTIELRAGPVAYPPSFHAERHELPGLGSPVLTGGVATLALACAIVLFAFGAVVGGLILLALAAAFLALFASAVRREPESQLVRISRRSVVLTRMRGRFVLVSARARCRSALELLKLRGRQLRLRSELRGQMRPLGEAVYDGREQHASALKANAGGLAEELRNAERQASEVLDSMREEIERERAASDRTRVLTPPEREDSP
jgi:hypothetical protein